MFVSSGSVPYNLKRPSLNNSYELVHFGPAVITRRYLPASSQLNLAISI